MDWTRKVNPVTAFHKPIEINCLWYHRCLDYMAVTFYVRDAHEKCHSRHIRSRGIARHG
jgi:uncharacterized OB-fold protein